MASITVEIVSKTTSEAGTTFVLAASEEEIKRAGFVPYFVDPHFQGAGFSTTPEQMIGVTPYGSVVLGPAVVSASVYVMPFVPALTENHIDMEWLEKNWWKPFKLVKTSQKPNGTYQFNHVTPSMNVGDTLVFYDTKPADPA